MDQTINHSVPKANKTSAKRKREICEVQRFFIRSLMLVLLLYVFFSHIIGLAVAPNNDMFPRIDQGDLLMFYRLSAHYQSGEVIVFTKNETQYIGRIVACPGDQCEVTVDQHLRVNGSQVFEPSIFYETPMYEGFLEYPLTLADGEFFILSDKRNGAEDSRYFGPVKREEILGTVITVLRRNNV